MGSACGYCCAKPCLCASQEEIEGDDVSAPEVLYFILGFFVGAFIMMFYIISLPVGQ